MVDYTQYLTPVEPVEDDPTDFTQYLTPLVSDRPKVEDQTEEAIPTLEGPAPEGVRDLTDDAVFAKISPYMSRRFGMTEDKHSRQEIVDAYVNTMRKFNFGQSVVTVSELAYLNSLDDVGKAEAAAAYNTFDSMKGAFAEGTSGMEKLDAVYDYGRALIVDPVNVVSLGVGKLLTGGGSRLAAQMAKEGVKKEVAKILKQKGATEGTKQLAKQIERQQIGKVLKSQAFKDASKKVARKEAFYTGLTDTVAGVSMDAVYQQAMKDVGIQTEYNMIQGSLAAAGGLFGTGLSMGLSSLSRAGDPDTDMLGAMLFDSANTRLADARKLAGDVGQSVKDLDLDGFQNSLADFTKNIEDFADKVERGSLIRLIGGDKTVPKATQIRKASYLGDEATKTEGLAQILAKHGVRNWTRRTEDDNFSNWLMDLVKEMPTGVQKEIDQAFRKTLGKAVPEYQGKSFLQALDMDAQVFSKAGQELNIVAQAAKTLQYIPKAEPDKMLTELVDAELMPVSQRVREAFSNKTSYLQRNLIRMLVTHPGTTALNLIGWKTASTLQSSADVLRGTLYGGGALLNSLMFNKEGAAKYANKAGLMYKLQAQKMRNLLDPHMTYEAAMDFFAYNPQAQKKMFSYLSGGIELEALAKEVGFEDFGKLAKEAGVEGADNLIANRNMFDKVMDGLQTIYGVKAQDMLTKTQEFMYAVDKRIRIEYGVTYAEFLQDPNLWKKMQGDEYSRIVSEAADDALRSVFAKPYGGTKGTLQFAAKVVEDLRKYPLVGAMVPFGQFFNNTLGHMMDYSGISLAHKYLAGTTRDPMELLTKSAVGISFIGVSAAYEMENLEDGLAWYQERSSDGSIRNRLYDFPFSFYKAIGRMAAHVHRDGEVPRALVEDVVTTFGPQQLTRQLGDSIKMSYDMLIDLATSDDFETKEVLKEFVTKSTAMYVSGYTRPIDPVNQVVAMTRGQNYVSPDRKQGSEWVNNSVRYVDELLDAMDLYTKPEAKERTLTSEPDRVPIGRIFGYREETVQSPIQEAFNEVGLPQWRTNIRTNIPKAMNDVNRIITPILNYNVSKFLDTPRWKSSSSKEKMKLLNQAVLNSKQQALDMLENSFSTDDNRSRLLYQLGQSSLIGKNALKNMLNEMGLDEDPSKLDTETIKFLIAYIKLEKEQEKDLQKALDIR